MLDVSRQLTGHLLQACGRQVTLWGGGGGEGRVKHNVKMTLFSAKIVWTSPLSRKYFTHTAIRLIADIRTVTLSQKVQCIFKNYVALKSKFD